MELAAGRAFAAAAMGALDSASRGKSHAVPVSVRAAMRAPKRPRPSDAVWSVLICDDEPWRGCGDPVPGAGLSGSFAAVDAAGLEHGLRATGRCAVVLRCTWRLTSGPACGATSQSAFSALGGAALAAAAAAAGAGLPRASRCIALGGAVLAPAVGPWTAQGLAGVVLVALDAATLQGRRPHPELLQQAALLAAELAGARPALAEPAGSEGAGRTNASLPSPDGAAAGPVVAVAPRCGASTAAASAACAAPPGGVLPGGAARLQLVVPPGAGGEFWFLTGRGVAAPLGRGGAPPSLEWYWRAPAAARRASVVYDGPECLAVRDAFPKSAGHILLLPRDPALRAATSVAALKEEHLPAVSALHRCARRLADQATAEAMPLLRRMGRAQGQRRPAWLQWRFGYHNPPSLRPLHLHLVTSDLQSPLLRTNRALEAFASPSRFVSAERLEAALAGGAPVGSGTASRAEC